MKVSEEKILDYIDGFLSAEEENDVKNFRQELANTFDKYLIAFNRKKSNKYIRVDLFNMLDTMINFSNHKISNIDCSKTPFLNDDDGPIIIEENVKIMEGAMIKGPVHICRGLLLKWVQKYMDPQ